MPFGHFSLLLLVCLLGQHQVRAQTRSDFVQTIEPRGETDWGTWGSDEWCPPGQYAYGFRAKVHGMQGGGDDTGATGIKLHCKSANGGHGPGITSRQAPWGSWTYSRNCDCNRFLSQVSMKSEPGQGGGWTGGNDDTAVNNFNFKCEDGNWMYGSGTPWGNWHSASCPAGSVICGLKTKVESDQRHLDDTALNKVKFHCCWAPTNRGSEYTNCATSIREPDPVEWVPTFYFDSKQMCYPNTWKNSNCGSFNTGVPVYYEVHKCNDNKIFSISYFLYFGLRSVCIPATNDWERVVINFKQCDRKYCIDSVAYYQTDGYRNGYYIRSYDYDDERRSVNVYVGKAAYGFYHNTCCSNCQSFCSDIIYGRCTNYFNDFRDPGSVWKPTNIQSFPTNVDSNLVGDRKRCDRNSCMSDACEARNWELYV